VDCDTTEGTCVVMVAWVLAVLLAGAKCGCAAAEALFALDEGVPLTEEHLPDNVLPGPDFELDADGTPVPQAPRGGP